MDLLDLAARAWAWVATAPDDESDQLYSGPAGVLLAAAEAVTFGGEVPSALTTRLRSSLLVLVQAPVDDVSLFIGAAGVAVALRAWSEAAVDDEAAAAVTALDRLIADRVLHRPPPDPHWSDMIEGDAGTLVALLPDPDPSVRAAANLLADRLVATADPAETFDPSGPRVEGGLQWLAHADYPRVMPGFSHGTAGNAYALTLAAHALGRPDLFDVAVRGARTLIAIGQHPDGWLLPVVMPQKDPPEPDAYGWCHGPTGTARLFALLDRLDPRPEWTSALEACAAAVRGSGLPERRYPGFWDNVARCCGTAGVGEFALDRYAATGDDDWLGWARLLADDVGGRALVDTSGARWSNLEYRSDPPDLPPEPGLMQGAAGIAAWFTRVVAVSNGSQATSPLAPIGM